jgi:ribosomal protein S18 acetylase RimI-like enzyme
MTNPQTGSRPWVVRSARSDEVAAVEPLWQALYRHQKAHGMLLDVPTDSFKHWAASLRATLGRFTCLFVAEAGGELIGFLAGWVRTLPPYFGGYPVGFISDVYVSEQRRSGGIGRALLERAVEFFAAQRISRVELHVLVLNEKAREFYRKLGWKEELVQMVWQIDTK